MIIRPAEALDAAQMAHLLNSIIAIGGTTAHLKSFDKTRMQTSFINPPLGLCCFLMEDRGRIVGFQNLEWSTNDIKNPADWVKIASFVDTDQHGRGIGKALFHETCKKARSAKASFIQASIRADNEKGLRFYTSLGFFDYEIQSNIPLSDGTLVDRIIKKFPISALF